MRRGRSFLYVAGAFAVGFAALVSFAATALAGPPETPVPGSISPSSGSTHGGTSVSIFGTGFTGATIVQIDGVPVSGFSVVNDGQINATTGAYTGLPPSTGSVYVSNGTIAGSGGSFTYNEPPATVTSISKTTGSSSGNTIFNISGTDFNYTTSVTVGGVPVSSFTVNNNTSITVTTAADTQVSSPTVSFVSPNHGGTGGGTGVTITGSGFGRLADVVVTNASGTPSSTSSADIFYYLGVSGVSIGGSPATNVTVLSPGQLTATAPAGIPGVANVLVTNSAGNSGTTGNGDFTYTDGGPGITTIGPQEGLTSGGNTIQITGSNFVPGTYANSTPGTTVTIGGASATNVSVSSTSTLSATVPPGTAGAQQVVVSTIAGNATSSYLYVAPANPTITSVSPDGGSINNGGTIAGGVKVQIFGTNFLGATSVTFGGVAVNGFQIISDGEIDTTTPTQTTGGAVNVTVTVVAPNNGGTFTGTGTGVFTYVVPPPTVNSIAPNTGTTAGGTAVTILGQYFTGATQVTIGGTAVTSFNVVSDSKITAVTAPHAAGPGLDVVVTTANGPGTGASLYTYGTPVPTVTSVAPSGGSVAGGQMVTIYGQFFTGETNVTFGGNAATNVVFVNDGELTATTPAHGAGVTSVAVTTSIGTGTGANVYTYGASPPTVTGISPSSGTTLGGTQVTITGTGFTGTPQVTIGGVAAAEVTVVNPTTITAVTPAGTGSGVPVIVTTSFGSSAPANIYSYVAPTPPAEPAPTITGITPNSGTTLGGTPVTITGTNFTGATAVTFAGIAATNVVVVNATTITALTPPGTGLVNVAVTTPGGTVTGNGLYTYVTAPPTVTAVSPNTGSSLGGTSVTITGTNFTGATAVTFGGTPATSFTVLTATTITATTPAGTGTVNVTVTTPSGPGTGNLLFTYVTQPAPTVTAITPNGGSIANGGNVAGGTSVTITGTNFVNVTAVTIGGNAATFVSVLNSTTITAITPAHAPGQVNVAVTTQAGTGTGTNLFTYVEGPPTVTGISPNVGPVAGNTFVTITGTNFTGATAVTIGGNALTAVTYVSSTQITGTTPAHASGPVNVVVTTPAGTGTGTNLFTYEGPPTVTGISPSAGPPAGNTSVTITGTNFTGATAVTFGGAAATSFTVVNFTTITATTPAGTGVVNVDVTAPGGTGIGTNLFSYQGLPVVTSLTTSTGPPGGGTTVTINGSNFTNVTGVMFGSTPATSFTVTSPNSITVTSPPGSGTVNVTVTTTVGSSTVVTNDQFTYAPKTAPMLTLTSTPNPSLYGQAVTFSANVTGTSPTGTVTFSEGGRQIGTAPLMRSSATNSIATFTIASLPVGSDPVTASYAGDANNLADPTTLIQVVNIAADSARLHQLQLAVMPMAANTSAQAITGAIGNAIDAGFSGACSAIPTSNGSGFTYCFEGTSPQDGTVPARQASAPIDGNASTLGYADVPPGTAAFAPPGTPPSAPGATPHDILAADFASYPPTKAAAPPIAQPREWLAWVDVRGSEIEQNSPGNDLKGLQGNTMFGLTRRFSPDFVMGLTVGYEDFNFTSQAYNGSLGGNGPTAGAYLGWRFGQLRFEAAGTWSDVFVSDSSGAATGKFTATRWLGFSSLTGSYAWMDALFEPTVQFYELRERDAAYTDSLGAAQASNAFETGRASSGVKVSHPVPAGSVNLVPYLGFYADYYFTMDGANTAAPGVTTTPLLHGWAARATGGVTAVLPGGAQVGVGTEYGGIGNSFQTWTVTLRGSVPF